MSHRKAEIRKKLIDIRSALSGKEVDEHSRIICQKLKTIPQYRQAETIFCYINTKNEVKTRDFIEREIKEGKSIYLPSSDRNSSKLEFYRVFDLDKDLQTGNYGIFEPVRKRERRISEKEAELVIVPGVAFDMNLNRIGYGKGYYDIFLSDVSENAFKVGFAYDFQIIDNIPVEKKDIRMDMIITEKRIIQ